MSLPRLAIRRPVFAWMLMIALIVFGALAFRDMGISQLPDVDFPVINVALRLDNAAPEVMESDVLDPVEDAVMGIDGIRTVSSSASQGQASLTIEFELDHSIDAAMQEVQTRIEQAQRLLPAKLYPPAITKTNPEDQPIIWVMLTSDGTVPLAEQMMFARNILKDQFSVIAGVGSVLFGGYVSPNLRVWLDADKLRRYDLTADDILKAIQSEQVEVPAGRIENSTRELNVRLLGEARSAAEFSKIRLSQRGGAPNFAPLFLGQVATVEEGLADLRATSRLGGKPVVGLGIVKQRGANAVAVADLVKAKLAQLQSGLPKGLGLEVKLDTTTFIRESIDELNFSLLLAALLTSVVCYLFLGSWSSTFNVLLAIPTSIVGTFLALRYFGFTLNTFTLLGLSLAIGIVVDDAIMMLENIVRHAEMGKPKRQAALDGAVEITFAALAATIAIAAIFVPVIFMKGVIGRFFFQYGITVTVAVLLSLLEALTLTPMRCAQFLSTGHDSLLARGMNRIMDALARAYGRALAVTLKLRWLVLLAATATFAYSLRTAELLPKELIPEQDQSLFLLTLKAPVGTALPATSNRFAVVEGYLSKQPEVLEVYTTIGNYQGSDLVNAGQIYVMLKAANARAASQAEVMGRVRREVKSLVPDTEVFVQSQSQSGFSASRGFPIEFHLQGPDWARLVQLSSETLAKLRSSGLMTDVNTDLQPDMPEVAIIPDREQAARRGVSVDTMGSALATLIGGTVFDSTTQFPKDGHRYDIRVRSLPSQHQSIKDLSRIYVRNNRGASGELVPLSAVTHAHEGQALQLISRLNRERAIPIFANVAPGASQQDAIDFVARLARDSLPPGYHITVTGSAQTFGESFRGLVFALLLGILVAYMVLGSQFNSFIHPITVLLALPFSLSGAIFALDATHQSLNLFSMIGIILLMGIVKKNSILLVDFANQQRRDGRSPREALLVACPIRLRPILMTSIATIAGALPAALALGPGAETRIPMAVTIVGGVALSTVLTLFVVPAAYEILAVFERPSPADEPDAALAHEVHGPSSAHVPDAPS